MGRSLSAVVIGALLSASAASADTITSADSFAQCFEITAAQQDTECVVELPTIEDTSGTSTISDGIYSATLPTSRAFNVVVRFESRGCLIWNHRSAFPYTGEPANTASPVELVKLTAPSGVVAGSRVRFVDPCLQEWRDGSAGGGTGIDVTGITLTGAGAANVEVLVEGDAQYNFASTGTLVDTAGLSTVAGTLRELPNAGVPDGPHFVVTDAYASTNSPESFRASTNICPGTETGGSCIIRDESNLNVTPHPDLVGHTPLAIGTEPSYSTIVGGYDAIVNHQAGTIVGSPHAYIGSGLGGGHISILGSATSFSLDDCEYLTIVGGQRHRAECVRTASGLSRSNSILGGEDHFLDGDDVSVGTNFLWNTIVGGSEHRIYGDAYGAVILGGLRSGVSMGPGLASGASGYGAVVTGNGSKVMSADPGDGTEVAPHFAQASGLGARSWLSQMRCFGASWPGGESPTLANADAFGTLWAETLDCDITLNNFNVNAGDTENLWLDQQENYRPFAITDSVWYLTGTVLCADRNLDYGGQAAHVWHAFEVDHVVAIHAGETGDASIFNSSGVVDADDSVALTKTAFSDGGGTYIDVTATLEARDGAASLDAGWDIEVTADATGRTNSGSVNCSAAIDANIITEAN